MSDSWIAKLVEEASVLVRAKPAAGGGPPARDGRGLAIGTLEDRLLMRATPLPPESEQLDVEIHQKTPNPCSP